MVNTPSQYPIIAGGSAGRPIRCAPEVLPTFNKLQQAAQRGNHWARIAVKELSDLTNGQAGKQNVYVRPGKAADHHTPFAVFLPGLKATVYHWTAKGGYTVVDLQLDGNYFEATQSEQRRLGLYRVRNEAGRWATQYVPDGDVLREKGRLVAVADTGYDTVTDAANSVVPRAMGAPNIDKGRGRGREGCDLHFTPGAKHIGGLVNYDAQRIDAGRASAVHLASSMVKARSSRVIWVADHGGSAVITQAMQILVDKGVTLKDHTVHLYRPRTAPSLALQLAHKLELTMDENFANTGLSVRGALSQWSVSDKRLKNEEDPYNKASHLRCWINGLTAGAGVIGLGTAGAAAAGASLPMLAGIVTIVSVGSTSYHIGQSLKESVSHRLRR